MSGIATTDEPNIYANGSTGKPRVIIVGDVHGCIDELRALLRKCHYRQGVDRLISVGDLVGKGPDSFAVIRLWRSLGGECVMGNWEVFIAGNPTFAVNDYKRAHPGCDATTIPSWTDDELHWIRTLPYTIDIPEHDIMVVHAGLVPGVALSDQKQTDMAMMRNLLADGTATSDIKQGTAWCHQWKGPRTIVFGHDAQRGFQRADMALGLDTGAVYGRQLTALILPGRQLCEVQSAKVYSNPAPKKPLTVKQRLQQLYKRYDHDGTHLPYIKSIIRLVLVILLIRLLWSVVNRLPD